MLAKGLHGPWLWPLLLTLVGISLLLNNFLFLDQFDATKLWPIVFVIVGTVILVRGDVLPTSYSRTFGITRGTVESATLEISSGEIDILVRVLQQEGRLIAGQFALASRPIMYVNDTHANLKMLRSGTPWISFTDWEMGLARDLPWQVLVSTSLGKVDLNLAEIIVQDVVIASGLGDIRVICPFESLGSIRIHSGLGNVHLLTPVGYRVQIKIDTGKYSQVYADNRRYEATEDGVYIALDINENAPLITATIETTFGDIYLT